MQTATQRTSDYKFRRKREREVFIRQRLDKFMKLSELNIHYGVDWMRHLGRSDIQLLISDARKYLIYSQATNDYSIWLVLYFNFYKLHLKNKV